MSSLSRLLGMAQKALDKHGPSLGLGDRGPQRPAPSPAQRHSSYAPRTPYASGAPRAPQGSAADRQAIARYDYLMQTADPGQIEQVHREAFARLTPAQREQVESRMRSELPAHEQPRSSSPDDLAVAATRTEMAQPGLLRGLLARAGRGPSRGSGRGAGLAAAGAGLAGAGLAGGLLATVAGGAVVSAVAAPLLEQAASLGVDFDALAQGVDLGAIADGVDLGGLTGGAEEIVAGAGESFTGFGEQVSGLGEQLGSFGLDDLFGR